VEFILEDSTEREHQEGPAVSHNHCREKGGKQKEFPIAIAINTGTQEEKTSEGELVGKLRFFISNNVLPSGVCCHNVD